MESYIEVDGDYMYERKAGARTYRDINAAKAWTKGAFDTITSDNEISNADLKELKEQAAELEDAVIAMRSALEERIKSQGQTI